MSTNSYTDEELKLWRQKRGLEKLQFLLDRMQSQNGSKFPQIISQDGYNFIKSFLISGNFISEGLDIELTGKTVMKAQDNIDFLNILLPVFEKALPLYNNVENKLKTSYSDTIYEKEYYCYTLKTKNERQLSDLLYCLGLTDESGEDPMLCSINQHRVKVFGIGIVLFKNLFSPIPVKYSPETVSATQEINYQDTSSQQLTRFDYFICHASEDKNDIARSLTNYLLETGKNCWYDEIQFHSSKNPIKSQFKEGIELSQFGVPILSKSFFDKRKKNKQCREELRVMEDHNKKPNNFNVVPIWFNVDKAYIDKKHTNKNLSAFPSVNKDGAEEVARELLRMTAKSSI